MIASEGGRYGRNVRGVGDGLAAFTRKVSPRRRFRSGNKAFVSGRSLMAAYMIVLIKITREEPWPEYRRRVSELFVRHGARYLVRGGPVEALEGRYDGRRMVVFEFPSMEVIRSLWHSPEYADIKALREDAGELDVWAVEGV